MPEIIDAAGVEYEDAPSNVIDAEGVDYEPVIDAGPEARRAASGAPAGPKSYTDAELGLDPGPVKTVYVSPLVQKAFPSVAAALAKQPTNATEAAARDRVARLVAAQNSVDEAGRTVGGMAAGGAVAQAGKAMGTAAGLGPKVANVVGGSLGGATASTIADKSLEHTAEGAAAGAAFAGMSDLMGHLVKRVGAASAAKSFGNAAKGKNAEKLAEQAHSDVANVVRKYEIESVKNPQVAKEAIESGIKRAEAVKADALKAAQEAGRDTRPEFLDKNPLAKDAMKTFRQAEKELEVLNALRPIATKIASAQQLRPTLLSRIGNGAARVAKTAIPATVGAGVYHALTSGDGK